MEKDYKKEIIEYVMNSSNLENSMISAFIAGIKAKGVIDNLEINPVEKQEKNE